MYLGLISFVTVCSTSVLANNNQCQQEMEYCMTYHASSCFDDNQTFIIDDSSEDLVSYERQTIVEPFLSDLDLNSSQQKLLDEWQKFVLEKGKKQDKLFLALEQSSVSLFRQLELQFELAELDKDIVMGEMEFLEKFKRMLRPEQVEKLANYDVHLND